MFIPPQSQPIPETPQMSTTTTPERQSAIDDLKARLAALEVANPPRLTEAQRAETEAKQRYADIQQAISERYGQVREVNPLHGTGLSFNRAPIIIRERPTVDVEDRGHSFCQCGTQEAFARMYEGQRLCDA
jgi:hypothetical protein